MKRKLLYITLFVIVLVLVMGGIKLRHERQQTLTQVSPPEQAPWAVNVATVTQGRATQGFPALALVKGANDVAITPRLSGVILSMLFREGSQVKKGELLAEIDTQELRDQLASLRARRQSAQTDATRKQRDAQRAKKLLKKKGISESSADQMVATAKSAKEQVQSLDNQIAAAETHLNYAHITAPFTGVISARMADSGDFAAVGKPIYRLISTKGGRLEVRLPSEVLEQVHIGTEVILSDNKQALTFTADRVFPSLDQRSLGHIDVDLTSIPFNKVPGALIHARVITQAISKTYLVPEDALLPSALSLDKSSEEEQKSVWRITPGITSSSAPTIQRVPVKVLLHAKEGIAVQGKLQAGDRVVVAHETTLFKLRNGDKVMMEEQR